MTPTIGFLHGHGHTKHFAETAKAAEAAEAAEVQGKHHKANVFELLLLQDFLHRHSLGAEIQRLRILLYSAVLSFNQNCNTRNLQDLWTTYG